MRDEINRLHVFETECERKDRLVATLRDQVAQLEVRSFMTTFCSSCVESQRLSDPNFRWPSFFAGRPASFNHGVASDQNWPGQSEHQQNRYDTVRKQQFGTFASSTSKLKVWQGTWRLCIFGKFPDKAHVRAEALHASRQALTSPRRDQMLKCLLHLAKEMLSFTLAELTLKTVSLRGFARCAI